jgi:hypothetical protein
VGQEDKHAAPILTIECWSRKRTETLDM